MGPQPDRPIADPLLRPEGAPRDARGAPVRAPLGNSIRTLVAFVLLVIIGIGVWWFRRPDDLSTQLGGREWAIIDVDGTPAQNQAGTVSTFVLDGTGEIRATLDCNIATGTWSYDDDDRRLVIDWTSQTSLVCPDGWPATYLPDGGSVSLDGATLRIESDDVEVRAVALADRDPAAFDDVAGSWISGEHVVEIGPRGLFEIDDQCHGSWTPTDDDSAMLVEFDEVQPDACSLEPVWTAEAPVVPTVVDGAVFLRRDRPIFPLDRDIIRLDPQP